MYNRNLVVLPALYSTLACMLVAVVVVWPTVVY